MWLVVAAMIFGGTFVTLGLLYLAFINRRGIGRSFRFLAGAIVVIICIVIAVQNFQYWGPVVLGILESIGNGLLVIGIVLAIIVALVIIGGIIVVAKGAKTAGAERREDEAAEKQRIADATATYEQEQAEKEAAEKQALIDAAEKQRKEEAAEKKRIAEAVKAAATYPHLYADDEPEAKQFPDLYAGEATDTDTHGTIYGGR